MDHHSRADFRLPVLIVVAGSGATGVSLVIRPVLKDKEKTMSTTHRIDVHQHVVPPFYAKALIRINLREASEQKDSWK